MFRNPRTTICEILFLFSLFFTMMKQIDLTNHIRWKFVRNFAHQCVGTRERNHFFHQPIKTTCIVILSLYTTHTPIHTVQKTKKLNTNQPNDVIQTMKSSRHATNKLAIFGTIAIVFIAAICAVIILL